MKKILLLSIVAFTSNTYAGPNLYVSGKIGASNYDVQSNKYKLDMDIEYGSIEVNTTTTYKFADVQENDSLFATIAMGTDLEFLNVKNMRIEGEYSYRNKISATPSQWDVYSRAYQYDNPDDINEDEYTASGKDYDFDIKTQNLMINAYYDFVTDSKFTPFVNLGLGVSRTKASMKGIINTNYTTIIDGHDTSLAWAIGAGLNYKINNQTSLDLSYRYVDFGGIQINKNVYDESQSSVSNSKLESKFDLSSQDFIVGLRYKF